MRPCGGANQDAFRNYDDRVRHLLPYAPRTIIPHTLPNEIVTFRIVCLVNDFCSVPLRIRFSSHKPLSSVMDYF